MQGINIENHKKYFMKASEGFPEEVHASYMTLLFFIVSGNDILGQSPWNPEELSAWIYSQQVTEAPYAGFRPNPSTCVTSACKWDYSSIASTYSALGILKILGDDFSRVSKPALLSSLSLHIHPDGSVASHLNSLENDLRFVYCLCAICHLLDDWTGIPKDSLFSYISSCRTYEGAFGISPGLEAHGGATYCAVSSIFMLGRIDQLENPEELVEWLVMRQGTGFCGRVGKAEDSCYGYWVGMALRILKAERFINVEDNLAFYYECQSKFGGFSKYPGLLRPDFTHSYLGLCALSVLGVDGISSMCPELGVSLKSLNDLL